MITHYKGKYRLKAEYDRSTNQFPRKLDNTLEDIDVYIDCRYGNRIFSYGHGVLQAYIPSIIRGHNIIKHILNNLESNIIFDIEKTDSEVLFKFKSIYDDKIIPLLKPKTAGASISPFSTKNQPKTKYRIPDEDLVAYKNIISKIPRERILDITHSTNSFIKSLATKKNNYDSIKADMISKGLKGKEYIHNIGCWNKYMSYLKENVC